MNFVRSVSGLRGITGKGFDPEKVVVYSNAIAQFLGGGTVCLGRDPRKTGEEFSMVAAGSLMAAGMNVVDLGIVTTPTVLINVGRGNYSGGVIITASHNPEEWNAVKFVKKGGVFFNAEDAEELFKIVDSHRLSWENFKKRGTYTKDNTAEERHLDIIAQSKWYEKCEGMKVVVDTAGGASSSILPELCRRMGCKIVSVLGGCKDGNFTRGLEPVPENLEALSKTVRKSENTIGLATDTDGDRLALVDEDGNPIGEEKTLQLAVMAVLEREKGDVVANVSTSSAVKNITENMGCHFFLSPVGEGKVVDKMMETNAIIGGEGNGGVIFPSVHHARDAQTGAMLILSYLHKKGISLKEAVRKLPLTYMIKTKIVDFSGNFDSALFEGILKNSQLVEIDGIRWQNEESWFHVRKSGTENALRIIVESNVIGEDQRILETIRKRLERCAE
ncbi:phosphoglucosamine mutase [candidate division WOR-3 bacterium]|nr:phosphoglucosamine mutase [candidate division WOR-3 bacterium]